MILCSFSGIYELEEYKCLSDCSRIFLGDIEETRGYCSDKAYDIIGSRIKEYCSNDIHMTDNGNYHYMTKLWTDKLTEKFDLVVFDHHTDMQPPSLIPFLSCGSWILDCIKDNKNLDKVWLIGPPGEAWESIPDEFKNRIIFISQDKAESKEMIKINEEKILSGNKNIYISIDKDVLSENELKVNWDQGTMKVQTLELWLKMFDGCSNIIGIDICGEPEICDEPSDIRKSILINKRIIEALK